jgi:ankyrin repeat protein
MLILEICDLQDKTDGMTALMYAAHGGHFQITKLLVEHGADVNKQRGKVSND